MFFFPKLVWWWRKAVEPWQLSSQITVHYQDVAALCLEATGLPEESFSLEQSKSAVTSPTSFHLGCLWRQLVMATALPILTLQGTSLQVPTVLRVRLHTILNIIFSDLERTCSFGICSVGKQKVLAFASKWDSASAKSTFGVSVLWSIRKGLQGPNCWIVGIDI